MERRYYDYIITGVAAGVAAYTKDTYFKGPNETVISYGFSILLGFTAFILLNIVRYAVERGLCTDPRYRYLGTWIEDIHKLGQTHYSLFSINHNIVTNIFTVSGKTYDSSTHEVYADWHSTAVAFPEENGLYYLHQSTIRGQHGKITGLTRMNFEGNYGGWGTILDDAEPLAKVDFDFARLYPTDVRQAIGKARIRSIVDRKAFFKHRFNASKSHA
jgi:hypothetical protein